MCSNVHAASGNWNVDSDGNWEVDANWSGATFPNGAGNNAGLQSAITADRTITLGQDILINRLVVDDDNRYTLDGSYTLTLNRAGASLTQSGSGGITINANVAIANDATWNGAGSGSAILNGIVSDGGSGYSITKAGSYTLILNGNNTFSGGLIANAGTIEFGHNNAAGTGTLDLSGATLQAGGGSRTLSNALTLTGGSTIAGSNDLTFSGNMSMDGNRTLTIDNTGTTTFSGVISESGGARTLTKGGSGTLVLSGNNTYSGGLRINSGTVVFSNNGANGTGNLILNGGDIQAGGSSITLDEDVTVRSDFAIHGSQNLTLSGAMALGGTDRTVTVNNSATSTFSGVISGSGGFSKAGSGTLVFSGSSANTFSGATTVSAGTLTLSKAGALGNTSSITLSGGTLLLSGTDPIDRISDTAGITLSGGTLDTNNRSETFGALTLSADSIINLGGGGAAATITFASGSYSAGILTINNWTGNIYSSGTDDRIFFTADPGATFLSKIQFTGFAQGAYRLGTGEIVPVPEPGTWLAGSLLASLLLRRLRYEQRQRRRSIRA